MFRNLNEDADVGFDNRGLEINEENGKTSNSRDFNGELSTKIEITRSQFDQKRLHEEMKFKQPHAKSSELFF